MENYEKNWVRLPLKHAYNVRELGGYPTNNGKATSYHRFLRSDDLSRLDSKEKEFLYRYGLRTIIDLRSEGEALKNPDNFNDTIQYHRIPFLGRDASDVSQASQEDIKQGLVKLYLSMIDNRKLVKEIFEVIASAPQGCILFHCSAGKDRTGVLAMLLLGLAGVDREDIISNYMQSFIHLSRNPQFSEMIKHPVYGSLVDSNPNTIALVYDAIIEKHDSIENYLYHCDLSKEIITTVKERIRIE